MCVRAFIRPSDWTPSGTVLFSPWKSSSSAPGLQEPFQHTEKVKKGKGSVLDRGQVKEMWGRRSGTAR